MFTEGQVNFLTAEKSCRISNLVVGKGHNKSYAASSYKRSLADPRCQLDMFCLPFGQAKFCPHPIQPDSKV